MVLVSLVAVAAVLAGVVAAGAWEANDEIPGEYLPGSSFSESIDATNDAHDIFRVPMAAGQRFDATLTPDAGLECELRLLPPGTVEASAGVPVAAGTGVDSTKTLSFTAPAGAGGTYYLDVHALTGSGNYRLAYRFGPILSCSPRSLNFRAVQGSWAAVRRLVLIRNNGGGRLSNWTAGDNVSWLTLSPRSGTISGRVQVAAVAHGLRPGLHHGIITVRAPGAGASPQTIRVTLRVLRRTCIRIRVGGIVTCGGRRPMTVVSRIGSLGRASDPPDRRAVVDIQQKPAGRSSWSRLRTVRTNSRGRVVVRVRANVNTRFRAVRRASLYYAGDTSNSGRVRARYRVTLSIGAATYQLYDLGVSYPCTGRVYPASAASGRSVIVQTRRSGGWRRFRARRLNSSGIMRGIFSGSGRWTVRLYMPGSSTNLGGYSRARSFDLGWF